MCRVRQCRWSVLEQNARCNRYCLLLNLEATALGQVATFVCLMAVLEKFKQTDPNRLDSVTVTKGNSVGNLFNMHPLSTVAVLQSVIEQENTLHYATLTP
jgi:hypothetical protein